MKYSRKKKSLYKKRSSKKKHRLKKKRLKTQKGGFFGTIVNLAMLPFTHVAKPAIIAGITMIKNRNNANNNANNNVVNNANNNVVNNANNNVNNNSNNNEVNANNNYDNTNKIINNYEIKKYIHENNLNIHTLKKIIKYGDISTLKKIIEDLPTYNSKV